MDTNQSAFRFFLPFIYGVSEDEEEEEEEEELEEELSDSSAYPSFPF